MPASYTIRDATADDQQTLVAFTLQEALEAEAHEADEAAVRRGVGGAFGEEPRATYWVAEADGWAVGSISVFKEWSDFNGGDYWWIQSVYIVPGHRGSGLIDQLLDHVAAAARGGGAVDLRLQVHTSNARAQRAYKRYGFEEAPYKMMTKRL